MQFTDAESSALKPRQLRTDAGGQLCRENCRLTDRNTRDSSFELSSQRYSLRMIGDKQQQQRLYVFVSSNVSLHRSLSARLQLRSFFELHRIDYSYVSFQPGTASGPTFLFTRARPL